MTDDELLFAVIGFAIAANSQVALGAGHSLEWIHSGLASGYEIEQLERPASVSLTTIQLSSCSGYTCQHDVIIEPYEDYEFRVRAVFSDGSKSRPSPVLVLEYEGLDGPLFLPQSLTLWSTLSSNRLRCTTEMIDLPWKYEAQVYSPMTGEYTPLGASNMLMPGCISDQSFIQVGPMRWRMNLPGSGSTDWVYIQ
jgi:hypothetical protein